MSRSSFALIALALLVSSPAAAALCAAYACLHAPPHVMGCHPAPDSAAPSLATCCDAGSAAEGVPAVAPPGADLQSARVIGNAAAKVAVAARARSAGFPLAAPEGRLGVPLFTLHRSLLI